MTYFLWFWIFQTEMLLISGSDLQFSRVNGTTLRPLAIRQWPSPTGTTNSHGTVFHSMVAALSWCWGCEAWNNTLLTAATRVDLDLTMSARYQLAPWLQLLVAWMVAWTVAWTVAWPVGWEAWVASLTQPTHGDIRPININPWFCLIKCWTTEAFVSISVLASATLKPDRNPDATCEWDWIPLVHCDSLQFRLMQFGIPVILQWSKRLTMGTSTPQEGYRMFPNHKCLMRNIFCHLWHLHCYGEAIG